MAIRKYPLEKGVTMPDSWSRVTVGKDSQDHKQ